MEVVLGIIAGAIFIGAVEVTEVLFDLLTK